MEILQPKDKIYREIQVAILKAAKDNNETSRTSNELRVILSNVVQADFQYALKTYEYIQQGAFPVNQWYVWKDYEPIELIKILNAAHKDFFIPTLNSMLSIDEKTRSNFGYSLQILFRADRYDYLSKNNLSLEGFQKHIIKEFIQSFKDKKSQEILNLRLKQWWSIQIGNPYINKVAQPLWAELDQTYFTQIMTDFVKQQLQENTAIFSILERYLKQNQFDYVLDIMAAQYIQLASGEGKKIIQNMKTEKDTLLEANVSIEVPIVKRKTFNTFWIRKKQTKNK